jgi:hypothetical protein
LLVIVAAIFDAFGKKELAQRAVTARTHGFTVRSCLLPTLREKQREGWDAPTVWLC